MELGARFWLMLVAGCLAIAIGGLVLFLIIGWAWYAWGLVGTFLFFAAVLLAIAYVYDRRQQKSYEGA